MAETSDTITAWKRVGKLRSPIQVVEAVFDGKKVKLPSRMAVKNYGAIAQKHDPADANLYHAAFVRFLRDTNRYRRGRKSKAVVSRGKAHCYKAQWLMEHRDHRSNECLFFPSMVAGRPERVKYNFSNMAASRAMLLMSKGSPIDPKLMATHKCGNGHLSCVNPEHLEWGTAKSNAMDRVTHDAAMQFMSGVSEAEVLEIQSDPRLVNIIALERKMPAGVVSAIKTGEAWSGWLK